MLLSHVEGVVVGEHGFCTSPKKGPLNLQSTAFGGALACASANKHKNNENNIIIIIDKVKKICGFIYVWESVWYFPLRFFCGTLIVRGIYRTKIRFLFLFLRKYFCHPFVFFNIGINLFLKSKKRKENVNTIVTEVDEGGE